MLELAEAWPENDASGEPAALPSCRTARQLQPAEIDELVAAFKAGSAVHELAARFNLHRSTVGKHLKERGIDTRPPSIKAEDLPDVIDLYQAGWTLAQIGKKYGAAKNTVRTHLAKAGVPIRRT